MAPRPNKPINAGSDGGKLDAPTSRPRSHTWTKYGEAGRGSPSSLEVTIDDLTVVDGTDSDEPAAPPDKTSWSKYEQRSMPGHAKVVAAAEAGPDEPEVVEVTKRVREWVSTRRIDGRLYHRTDAATFIEVADTPQEQPTTWVEL